MVDSDDTKYYPTKFLVNADSFGFLISEGREEHDYHKTKVYETKEEIIKKLISKSTKTFDFDRAKQFHCYLCKNIHWTKWKTFKDHISKRHSDIQGELRDFPLRINGRYETVVKLVYRNKSNNYACEVCQKDWNSLNDLEKHLKENHTGVKGALKIDVAYGKTIIKYVKIHVKDSGTSLIDLDTSDEVTNDQGKEDIIDDPEEQDEESTVQEPLSVPMDKEKSYKYTCEVCQKDWDSMNDLEKHLRENHPRVRGELKIIVSNGKTIIGFVKKIWGSIPICLDTSDEGPNNQGKENIIDDPEERDEKTIVQDPLSVPMNRKKIKKYACELCQKDWDSMNDLEKHLKENHPGIQSYEIKSPP